MRGHRTDHERGHAFDYSRTVAGAAAKAQTPEEAAAAQLYQLRQDAESAVVRARKLGAVEQRDAWREEKGKLDADRAALQARLAEREMDAAISPEAKEHHDQAHEKHRELAQVLDAAREPRAMPAVAGELDLELAVVGRSAAKEDLLAWAAGLGSKDRGALASRLQRVSGGSTYREDAFAVALANHLASMRALFDFQAVLKEPRRFNRAAYERDRAARSDGDAGDAAAAAPVDSAPVDSAAEPGTSEPGPLPHLAQMEQTFGRSLGHVRARTDARDELAPLGASALTVGSDVTFAEAAPAPALVAHEATHVLQNERAGASAAMAAGIVAPRESAAEAEADAVAARVATDGPSARVDRVVAAPAAHVQLAPAAAATHDAAKEATPPAPPRAVDRATTLARLALQHLEAIQGTLVPAWSAAVSAMEKQAALEIAGHVIGGLTKIREVEGRMAELVPDIDAKAPQVSTAETDVYTEPADLAALMQVKGQLDAALAAALPAIAVTLSPQTFDGIAVAGATEAPPKLRDLSGYIAFEANNVVELLDEASYIEQHLVMPTDEEGSSVPSDAGKLREAVDRLEYKRSRPVNFFFLAAVLKKKGLWSEIQRVKSLNGKTPDELERKVSAQAKETGATADVGFWDADSAHSSLTYSLGDWAVTDSDGSHVTDMLASADPRARGELVMQLVRMGLLDRWASNVPWGHVQMIADSINDPQAERMLAPYWEDKGGVPSSREFFMERVDENLEEGGTVNEFNAFGWYLLNTGLDAFSFGGKAAIDDAHEARDEGLISDDAYWSSVGTASARTLVVGAAAAWTGGLAGGWAEGAALGMGVGEGGAALIGGAAGGAVGNVGGLFAADVYDQALMGKEGFSDFGDYGRAFAEGGAGGAALSGLSLAAGRFFPQSAQNTAQLYAARHPHLMKVMEASRAAGYGASVRVRMTAREFLDSFRGGGLGGGGMQPAFAGAHGGASAGARATSVADVASMPPEAGVWVTVRPVVNLAGPAMARLGDEGDPFELESIEAEDSLFDPYDEASRGADDATDTRGLGQRSRDALGEGREVDAMYAEESIPEPSRFPVESDDMGWWEGQRGNSNWHSHKADVIAITGGEPVRFVLGEPDFSPWTVAEVKVLGGRMTGTPSDFTMADQILARLQPENFANARAVARYRQENRLTWHHKMDMETLQLVPTDLNSGYNIPHIGGASLSRHQP